MSYMYFFSTPGLTRRQGGGGQRGHMPPLGRSEKIHTKIPPVLPPFPLISANVEIPPPPPPPPPYQNPRCAPERPWTGPMVVIHQSVCHVSARSKQRRDATNVKNVWWHHHPRWGNHNGRIQLRNDYGSIRTAVGVVSNGFYHTSFSLQPYKVFVSRRVGMWCERKRIGIHGTSWPFIAQVLLIRSTCLYGVCLELHRT